MGTAQSPGGEQPKWQKILRIAFGIFQIVLYLLIFIQCICKLSTLSAHPSSEINLEDFPTACSPWALGSNKTDDEDKSGCTRIVIPAYVGNG